MKKKVKENKEVSHFASAGSKFIALVHTHSHRDMQLVKLEKKQVHTVTHPSFTLAFKHTHTFKSKKRS